jgi:hypothetical protein
MDKDLATDVKHGSKDCEARACMFLGFAYETIGQDEDALREFRQALKACETAGKERDEEKTTPNDGRSKRSWLCQLGKCHASIAHLSSDATERDESLEKAICALTEAESVGGKPDEVAEAGPESSRKKKWSEMTLAFEIGSCLYARAFLQYSLDENGHVVRPAAGLFDAANLRLKANLQTATEIGVVHYVKASTWQLARLTFMMSRDVNSDVAAVVLLTSWCRLQGSSAHALCGCCGKLRGESDASKVPSEERKKREELAGTFGLPFENCFSEDDTLAPMSACGGCMLIRSLPRHICPFIHWRPQPSPAACARPRLSASTSPATPTSRVRILRRERHLLLSSHACVTSDRYCSSSCEEKAWKGEQRQGFIAESPPPHKLTCPLIKDLARAGLVPNKTRVPSCSCLVVYDL